MGIGKKIILFAIIGLMSVWFGFFAFTNQEISNYYMVLIYYFLTFELIIWFVSIIDAYRAGSKASQGHRSLWQNITGFLKSNWVAFIIAVSLMSIGFYVCKPDFRILTDEAVILSDTKALAESKVSVLPLSSIYKPDGKQLVFANMIDKRPLLFQYLVSLLHSIVGYNPDNIFIANFSFGVMSLFLFYYLIQLKFGRVWGICGMILLGSYPLFLIYSACAGFELFNLLCTLILFLVLYKFINNPTAALAEVLIMGIPLIGQSRYESILAIFIAVPVIFFLLPKIEYSKLSYKMLLFPILCIPVPWLRIISDTAVWWENKNPADVFGLRFVYKNFLNALEFFFTEKTEYCIIAPVSYIAMIGLVIILCNLLKKKASKGLRIFWTSAFVFYALHALVRFMYVLVDFRHATANRLALVFLPLIVFFAIYALVKCNEKYQKRWFSAVCLVLVSILPFIYWSDLSQKPCGYNQLVSYKEYRVSRNILNKYYKSNDYCLICSKPFIYSPLGYSAVEDYVYVNCRELMKKCIEDGYFKYFLAMQIYTLGKPDYEIPEDFDAKIEIKANLDSESQLVFSYCTLKQ